MTPEGERALRYRSMREDPKYWAAVKAARDSNGTESTGEVLTSKPMVPDELTAAGAIAQLQRQEALKKAIEGRNAENEMRRQAVANKAADRKGLRRPFMTGGEQLQLVAGERANNAEMEKIRSAERIAEAARTDAKEERALANRKIDQAQLAEARNAAIRAEAEAQADEYNKDKALKAKALREQYESLRDSLFAANNPKAEKPGDNTPAIPVPTPPVPNGGAPNVPSNRAKDAMEAATKVMNAPNGGNPEVAATVYANHLGKDMTRAEFELGAKTFGTKYMEAAYREIWRSQGLPGFFGAMQRGVFGNGDYDSSVAPQGPFNGQLPSRPAK
jgi:hypothetical protein